MDGMLLYAPLKEETFKFYNYWQIKEWTSNIRTIAV
jgi:hypothetical protein